MTSDEFGDIEQLDENLRKWFKEKWVRFGPDGKIRGACARGSDKEGKPKCLPQKKAHALGKKGRKYAASKKRREDPNPERRGKAKNVATKKKNKDMNEEAKKCPHCGGPLYPESMINEKKDACYHKVRSRYKVWPSAYASGALVQCRKKGASNWGNKSKKNESSIMKGILVNEAGIGSIPISYIDPDSAITVKSRKPGDPVEIPDEYQDINLKKKVRGVPKENQTNFEVWGNEHGYYVFGNNTNAVLAAWPNGDMMFLADPRDSKARESCEIFAKQAMKPVELNALPTKLKNKILLKMSIIDQPMNENNIMKGLVKEEISFSIYIDNSPYTNYSNKIEAERDAEFLRKKYPDRKIEIKRQGDDVNIGEPVKGATRSPLTSQDSGNKQKIAYTIKHGGAVPKELTFSTEGVIVGHDANDPDVAILGGAGTYKLSNVKKKAQMEATQLAKDVSEGKFKNSAYNVKQLANTLNTIVAAEEEMEKKYFGEAVDWQRGENNNEHDHTLKDAEEYLTHLYPVVKKYMIRRAEVGFRAGLRPNEKEFLKSMSHMKDVDAVIKYLGLNKLSTMSGSKQATSSIGYTWTTFLSPNKKAAIIYYQDRGMGQDMIYIAAADKALHRKIYDLFVDAGVIVGRDKKVKEPELPKGTRVSGATSRDDAYNRAMNKFLGKNDDGVNEDYTGEFAAEKTAETNPYGGQRDRQHRGAISETPTDNPTGASGEGGWRKYKPKSAGITESYPANVKQYARDLAREMREEGYDWEPVDLSDTEEAIDDAREQLSMFASSNMCDFFGDYDIEEQLQIIKMFNKKFGGIKENSGGPSSLRDREAAPSKFGYSMPHAVPSWSGKPPAKTPHTVSPHEPNDRGDGHMEIKLGKNAWGGWLHGVSYTVHDNGEIDITELYNHRGERYDLDELSPKMTATVIEKIRERFKEPDIRKYNGHIDEDTAYAGGMGQGGNAGQSYRKFKPKSAGTFKEEQLDEKCWDTHKQVGMKKKGDKMVPNCVAKESTDYDDPNHPEFWERRHPDHPDMKKAREIQSYLDREHENKSNAKKESSIMKGLTGKRR